MKRQGLLIALSLTLLLSCANYGEDVINHYENKAPYLVVNKTNEETLKEISGSKYLELFNSGTTFICLLGTSTCSACKASKEHYLIPYIKNTQNEIYELDVYNNTLKEELVQIKFLQPEESNYIYYNDNNELVVKRPLLQIVSSSEVVVYELGVTKNLVYMLEGYIV